MQFVGEMRGLWRDFTSLFRIEGRAPERQREEVPQTDGMKSEKKRLQKLSKQKKKMEKEEKKLEKKRRKIEKEEKKLEKKRRKIEKEEKKLEKKRRKMEKEEKKLEKKRREMEKEEKKLEKKRKEMEQEKERERSRESEQELEMDQELEMKRKTEQMKERLEDETRPQFLTVEPLNPIPEPEEVPEVVQEKSTTVCEEVSPLSPQPSDDLEAPETTDSTADQRQAVSLMPRPERGLVYCCVQRCRGTGNDTTYRMYNEDTQELLMVARKNKSENMYEILLGNESGNEESCVAELRFNSSSTDFTLRSDGMTPGVEEDEDFLSISYKNSFMSREKTMVRLPCMCREAYEGRPVTRCMNKLRLRNKKPVWNEEKDWYNGLNFNGRVTEPSVKNFQLISALKPDLIVMQFGRKDDDWFALDYRSPLCALRAFAVSLIYLEAK